ncbi:hypothetical protein BD777DRAFT_127863 [Yarrowia lipolytica]|nr:hypothetical protein BD777DRAFT_127863 [Yarrowia lipolytica]
MVTVCCSLHRYFPALYPEVDQMAFGTCNICTRTYYNVVCTCSMTAQTMLQHLHVL